MTGRSRHIFIPKRLPPGCAAGPNSFPRGAACWTSPPAEGVTPATSRRAAIRSRQSTATPAGLAGLAGIAWITARCADLESAPWPYAGRTFAGIIVTNYLHRPLFPQLLAALAPGGVLIYETFAAGNERYGRPANPDFLLRPGELLEVVRGRLTVVAYEDLLVSVPKPARVQRICAVDPGP